MNNDEINFKKTAVTTVIQPNTIEEDEILIERTASKENKKKIEELLPKKQEGEAKKTTSFKMKVTLAEEKFIYPHLSVIPWFTIYSKKNS